jgi:hypothetical protein
MNAVHISGANGCKEDISPTQKRYLVTRYKLRTLFSSFDATKMYIHGLERGVGQ